MMFVSISWLFACAPRGSSPKLEACSRSHRRGFAALDPLRNGGSVILKTFRAAPLIGTANRRFLIPEVIRGSFREQRQTVRTLESIDEYQNHSQGTQPQSEPGNVQSPCQGTRPVGQVSIIVEIRFRLSFLRGPGSSKCESEPGVVGCFISQKEV